MKHLLKIILIVLLSVGFIEMMHSCKRVTVPTVTTAEVSGITQTCAVSGGNVIDDGGAEVNSRGICWGINQNPTIIDRTKTQNGKGTGIFISYISGLTANTKYYVRAFAFNSEGTSYGNEISFSTSPIVLATLTTVVISISSSGAVCGGNITFDGGGSIIERGVCWSTNIEPTINDSITNDGFGIGTFISNISDLQPYTKYYVRAYATNNTGTAYGNEVSFTTLRAIPIVTTASVSDIKPVSAFGGGEVISDGGSAIIVRGFCWSESENPTTADSQTWEESPSIGSFTMFVINLKPKTTYFVRAFAANRVGTSYGNQVSFTTTSAFDPIIFSPALTYGTVADNDDNNYRTIPIGNQVWMAENLKTTKFHDGSPIPLIEDDVNWINLTTPGYCWYDNNEALFKDIYGAIYNWYVLSTGKLCPSGWHVPTDAEWTIMTNYLGGETIAGGRLKETGTSHWFIPNTGANNETGFTAMPGGLREMPHGNFGFVGRFGNYWSGDEGNLSYAWNRTFNFDLLYVYRSGSNKRYGYSVRCIKD